MGTKLSKADLTRSAKITFHLCFNGEAVIQGQEDFYLEISDHSGEDEVTSRFWTTPTSSPIDELKVFVEIGDSYTQAVFHLTETNGKRFWKGKLDKDESSRMGLSAKINVTEYPYPKDKTLVNYGITAILTPYEKPIPKITSVTLPSERENEMFRGL